MPRFDGGLTLFQKLFLGVALAVTSFPGASHSDLLHATLADAAAQPPRTATQRTAPVGVHLGHDGPTTCPAKRVAPSRWMMYGAQLINALIVGNAVRRGSYGHVLGNGSPVGYLVDYAALDLVANRLDRHSSCGWQKRINAFFALGAIYNAGATEFPK